MVRDAAYPPQGEAQAVSPVSLDPERALEAAVRDAAKVHATDAGKLARIAGVRRAIADYSKRTRARGQLERLRRYIGR